MDHATRLRRLHFRANHRGIKEGDILMGNFFAMHGDAWGPEECDWFEELLEEQDVDILAWATKAADVPERFQGPLMAALQRLDYYQGPK